jgi:hypothetical protein
VVTLVDLISFMRPALSIEIIAIRDGQVTERWGEWDEGEIQAQVGGRWSSAV